MSPMSAASSICSLISGTSSCGQLEFAVGSMFSPLNVGSSIAWGSLKSLTQPTFGHTATSASGTEQNFVYMMFELTWRNSTSKPRSSNCCRTTSPTSLSMPAFSATIRIFSSPSYLPLS